MSIVPQVEDGGRLVDAGHVANVLGVSRWWIEQQARENKIPHVRFGRNVRYDLRLVREWYRARMSGGQ